RGELTRLRFELGTKMREYYDAAQRIERLTQVRQWIRSPEVKEQIDKFSAIDVSDTQSVLREGAELMRIAEENLREDSSYVQGERNLLLLHVMELVEQLWIGVTADLSRRPLTRSESLELLTLLVESAKRLGYLSSLELESVNGAIGAMGTGRSKEFAKGLEQASRILEWARARVQADIGAPLMRYERIEPRAVGVIDDVLRSGVMLPAAKLLDRLALDAEGLRGGGHRVVGMRDVGTASLRGENAGLASGTLTTVQMGESTEHLRRDEIVVLRGLPPELPPVAGIITIGSAGKLSHISVLARNLGIPHASVGTEIAEALFNRAGERFILGVSAGRRVALGPFAAFSQEVRSGLEKKARTIEKPFLEIEADRLALGDRSMRLLGELKDGDSGRICGPKAAELGRLKKIFPSRVSDGVVIPFGVFVQHVDRPGANGAPSPLRRLQYFLELTKRVPPSRAERIMLKELERFREAVSTLPFSDGFVDEVKSSLARLGKAGTFGVFVRSDTNVEDLREFTGAGLNKTVPHRVGLNSVLAAIRKVWASPYTERSYRWRQRVLVNPEYVFPSVILHRTVPAEKSGVLVTADLETGEQNAITISAGEGVAAVVDGGAPQ
ncbi:MAG: PEP/pyruvate-binding domain-containing protein, partial [Myxococcota bacterium]